MSSISAAETKLLSAYSAALIDSTTLEASTCCSLTMRACISPLAFNKELEFIESITITNNSAFSPIFSANIEEFKLTFSFIRINDSVLPKQNDMEMKGTFAFFTEIDEVSSDVYSNYRITSTKE